MTNAEKEYSDLCRTCADQVCTDWRKSPVPVKVYIYFKPMKGHLLAVQDGHKEPAGYELACPEGLRPSVPYNQVYQWIWEKCRRVPCLSVD